MRIAAASLALALAGCVSPGSSDPRASEGIEGRDFENPYSGVVRLNGDRATVTGIPDLKFAGETLSAKALARKAQLAVPSLKLDASINLTDTEYAQLEAESAKDVLLWTKAFLSEAGYEYGKNVRDCEDYARLMRSAATLFSPDDENRAPSVFGVYVTTEKEFGGVPASEGAHALVAAWTDEGVFFVEPQGVDAEVVPAEDYANPVFKGTSD